MRPERYRPTAPQQAGAMIGRGCHTVKQAVLNPYGFVMQLIPANDTPRLQRLRQFVRRTSPYDAIVVIAHPGATRQEFAGLPEAQSWQLMHARSRPEAGQTRNCTLPNTGQTLAVIAYVAANATPFEQLALAGRALRDALARTPQSLALFAVAPPAARGKNAGPTTDSLLESLLSAALIQDFPLPSFRSKPARARRIKRISIVGAIELDLKSIAITARAQNVARALTALPPNKLDTRAYRRLLTQFARSHRLRLRWWDERALQRAGAGAFLAVAAGNARRGDAGIAQLSYRPARRASKSPQLALVGKGILFDTGGTNLKPHRSMLDMHTDMAGSAVALATLLALAEARAPIAADAWLAITENRIGPTAYQPQEIVRAANGTTIQVIHTDAEGRMALADTLVLAGRTAPQLIIDYATLTGACVYALTERMSGVFTSDDRLIEPLLSAGRVSGERVVHFPMDADFDADIESKVADIMQCAVDGKGDHIIAARFLQRFVPKDMPWVHMDLSSATRSGGLGHVTTEVIGFGVRYTLELLLGQDVLGKLRRS